MVDTCCDPTLIDFVIPANDDASKSISLIVNIMAKAIQEGLDERKAEKEKEPAAKENKDEQAHHTRARKAKKAPLADGEKEVVEEEKAEEEAEVEEEKAEE